jgi:hypothetical protein
MIGLLPRSARGKQGVLATIDWLTHKDGVAADRESIKTALETWTGGKKSAERKLKLRTGLSI